MYAIVDIETTGGNALSNSITEIAIYVFDGKNIISQFESLVNPQQYISPFITQLTGISNEMVSNAPTFAEIADEVYAILRKNIFVAHNVSFDYSYVSLQLQKLGYKIGLPKLCTVKLSRKVIPGLASYSLGKLCKTLHIEVNDRHRAAGDAKATVLLFEHLLSKGAQPHIDKMLHIKKPKFTNQLSLF